MNENRRITCNPSNKISKIAPNFDFRLHSRAIDPSKQSSNILKKPNNANS